MKTRRGRADRGPSRPSRVRVVPGLERFEDRLLLATFTVTNTGDSLTAVKGDGSLRGEILDSNATTTANQIVFSLPMGVQTISPVAPLPIITTAVVIDGRTAASFNPSTPVPFIQISGNNPMNTTAGPGLRADVAGVEFRNLIINNFNGSGIVLNGGGDTVAGCYIGVDPTGNVLAANTGDGITVSSANNTIGDPATSPNVISGNSTGISITGANATRNTVVHSFIGTNAAGTSKIRNNFNGIGISTTGNTIGGVSANGPNGIGNLISGNATGIFLLTSTTGGNVIQGNYIGTDLTGSVAIPNTASGIQVGGGPNNTIGSSVAGGGNVISGNNQNGIYIVGPTATLNQVQGNFIGVAANGTSPLGNTLNGVSLNGAGNNMVGGTSFLGPAPAFGNVIAYNGSVLGPNGVQVLGASNDGILSNRIYSNFGIGINTNGGNGGVKPPTLNTVQSGPGQTRIIGSYFGSPGTRYTIQFFSNLDANPSGAGDGENYLPDDLTLTTDVNGNAAISTILPTAVPVGYFVSATATQGVLTINNTSQFSRDVQATQAALTDLSVSTSAVPTTGPLLDQPYTYTLTVSNGGPDAATGVVLTDTIPANTTFVSTSAGTFASGVVTDVIGNLAAGASVTVRITVTPTALGSITNTAAVQGNELESDASNNVSSTTGTVAANADLSISITPSANPSPIGSPITYTINVGNAGPSPANGTVVTVNFPANFTNIVVMPDQGSFTVDSNNTVTINSGTIPASSSSTIVILATPNAIGPADVTASVTSTLIDPDTTNNSATASVTVANAADLGVQVLANPNPVLVGGTLIYSINVTNNGPSTASSPAIFDQLPAGVTFDPTQSSGSFSFANGAVTATLGPLAVDATVTLLLAVIPTVSGQLTNIVTVGDPNTTNPVEIDPDPANNTATTITQVSPADLGVDVINPSGPLSIGQQAVYRIEVTNNGPADATNVMLTDLFSGAAKIVSTSFGQISGNKVTANLGSLAKDGITTITIIVNPTASGTLVNSARVSSDELDPNPNNDTSSSSNLVSPVDLGIGMTTSPNPVLIGNPLTYVVRVTNGGPATATNVIFDDVLPAGAVLTSLVRSQGSFSLASPTHLVGHLGNIAPGASVTITYVITPTVLGTATSVASVTSDNIDTDGTNNSASTAVGVINKPGSIQFGSSYVTVPENAGSVTLTISRASGTLGAVTAAYFTTNASAVAGVNYVSTRGTVTFANGQATATIKIPVLDDHVIDGSKGFFVTLTTPTGGATIGAQAVTAVAVTNTDRDTVPPFVTNLVAIPNGARINGFVVTFDEPMDVARASIVGNYHVFLSGSGNSESPVALVAANYDPATRSVTLVPSASLPSNRFYHVVVNGSSGLPLTDTSGNVLSGSSGPRTNYEAYYGQGTNLTYIDAHDNSVNIQLTGGGTLAIFRSASGDATVVNLLAIVPHRSKLFGSVKKLNSKGTGHTFIGTINGFGQFGNVNSSLTTPAFYVGSAPVTAAKASVSVPGRVSAQSATTAHVALKKKTPGGPAHSTR